MTTFTSKLTDQRVIATCPLGSALQGTALSAAPAVRLASLSLHVINEPIERNERPVKAPEAAVATAQATAYVIAANGAGSTSNSSAQYKTQYNTMQHHTMWAFRGLEPWSDPA